jgi:hypothetical protein
MAVANKLQSLGESSSDPIWVEILETAAKLAIQIPLRQAIQEIYRKR